MIELRPLHYADYPLISDYLTRYPPEISEHTFTNLFVWRRSRPIWLAETHDSLIFVIEKDKQGKGEKHLFGPPAGPGHPLDILKDQSLGIIGSQRLSANYADRFVQAGMAVVFDENNADYVYKVEDLAELSGRNYHKKRNHVSHCLQKYTCTYEPISPNNIGECQALQDRWCDQRLCQIQPGLAHENQALEDAFIHFSQWQLIGGAIRVDGEIQAFTIGERLNQNTAVCHFEKAMPDIEGLGQLINHWFAKYALQPFVFVNREQDLGIPGLRQAKRSYHPDHMVEKFNVMAA